jgi:hypothetical protein
LVTDTSDEVTGPINLGNLGEFTIFQLAEMVLDITESKSRLTCRALPRDDPKRRRPDIAEANRVLGWQRSVPLQNGLEKTIPYNERLLQSEAGEEGANDLPTIASSLCFRNGNSATTSGSPCASRS